MKKMNKKGFTLIELLAVIIILGILMIIAIPSVTTYIQNSRKSAFVDTASAYIDAVRTKVNEAKDLKFFDTKTLYLVPVGNEPAESCVSVESGGKSPFSETWKYAFVGVIYKDNGDGYEYFFIGEDGANQGLGLITQNQLSKNGNDNLYSSYKDEGATISKIDSDASGILKGYYKPTTAEAATATSTTYYITAPSGMTNPPLVDSKLKPALTTNNLLNEEKVSSITKVVVIAKSANIPTCKK